MIDSIHFTYVIDSIHFTYVINLCLETVIKSSDGINRGILNSFINRNNRAGLYVGMHGMSVCMVWYVGMHGMVCRYAWYGMSVTSPSESRTITKTDGEEINKEADKIIEQ